MNNIILTENEQQFLLNYLTPMVNGREYALNLAKKLPKTAKQKDELVEMLTVQTHALKSLKQRIYKQQANVNLVPFFKDMEVAE
jgi:hypothetical protein